MITTTWANRPDDLEATPDTLLDVRGLMCPMPLLKAKLALKELTEGQSLYLLASDKNSQTDLVAFCRKNGHQLRTWISQDEATAQIYCFFIIKNG